MGVLVRIGPELLVASLVWLAGCTSARPTVEAPPRLERLPDVPVTMLDDRPTHLADVIAHRPAVVAFWATWCDACQGERAALDRLEQAARPRGGVVVGVAVGETSAVVRDDLGRHPTTCPELVDEPFAFADAAGVHTLPAVFVLDRDGRVVHAGGALDHAALEAFRRQLGVE